MDDVVSKNEEIVKAEEEELEKINLPPGFRFHPTDEELITHYLKPKVLNTLFSALAICEVDLNKVEPWDLPWKAKIGEKEWYFFCVRERKYPTGLRTNRATKSGYWKATGKDKMIFEEKSLVGMKKTLVFYKGRAPRGVKTNWVMHEYRLEGKYMVDNLPKTAKNEWVISRVFQKGPGGTKVNISGLMKLGSRVNKFEPVGLPPLMDSSPYLTTRGRDSLVGTAIGGSSSHVTCFSDYKIEGHHLVSDSKNDFNVTMLGSASNLVIPNVNSFLDSNSLILQENASILKMLLDNEGTKFKKNLQNSSTDVVGLSGPVNLDGYWKF